jgi:hypothetical protein
MPTIKLRDVDPVVFLHNVGAGGVLDPDQALEVKGIIHISEEQSSTPSAPSDTDGGLLYTKVDGSGNARPYWIADGVAEVDLTGGSSQQGTGDITTDDAWATKGDLIIATANDTASVLTVGVTNDWVLTVDSTATHGVAWKSAGGGGASTALSNLSSVAINTSLISDTDNTDDLGSAAKMWKDLHLKGNATIGGIAYTWPSNNGENGEVLVTDGGGVLRWDGIAGTLSGGAENKLAIWESDTGLTSDVDLHWDSTNGRLGIGTGTTTPSRLLHVKQTTNTGTTAALAIENSYANGADASAWFKTIGGEWTIGVDESNSRAFTFGQGSVLGTNDQVIIATDGKVGIGHTNASTISEKLQVVGDISAEEYSGTKIILGSTASAGTIKTNATTKNIGIYNGTTLTATIKENAVGILNSNPDGALCVSSFTTVLSSDISDRSPTPTYSGTNAGWGGTYGGAFDNDFGSDSQGNSGGWWSTYTQGEGSITLDFGSGEEQAIAAINMKAKVDNSWQGVKSFKFQASNATSNTWDSPVTLLTVTDHPYNSIEKQYEFTNSTAYRYYRFLAIEGESGASSYKALWELEYKILVTGGTADTFKVKLGNIIAPIMPTEDPAIAGALWNDGNTVKISAG